MRSIEDLRKSAEAGSNVAQTILGVCYLDGIDTDVNYPEAFRLLSMAGTSRAVVNLARMYAEGRGIPQDGATAARLYESAAKAGELVDPKAYLNDLSE